MCHEGGCGVCIVAAEIKGETVAVNSCLVPILICDGYANKLRNIYLNITLKKLMRIYTFMPFFREVLFDMLAIFLS